jgi:hypothetical protein
MNTDEGKIIGIPDLRFESSKLKICASCENFEG